MFFYLFKSTESEIYLLKPKKFDILGLSLGLGFGYLRVFVSNFVIVFCVFLGPSDCPHPINHTFEMFFCLKKEAVLIK